MAKSNVTYLHTKLSVAASLRDIADRIESGEFYGHSGTLVLDCAAVFHFGTKAGMDESRAIEMTVFDLQYGIQRVMLPVVDNVREWEDLE